MLSVWCLVPGNYPTARRLRPLRSLIEDRTIAEKSIDLILSRYLPPAGEIHGELSMNLGFLLKGYVKENDLGKVYAAETGFYTARNPDTVRAADSAFIAKNRLPEKPSGGYLETVPDLTVEVVSLHDRPSAILEKVEECLNAGVKCIWVVYPKSRQGYVYQPDQPVEILSEDDTLTGSDVIPGFQCKVSEIFE